MQIFMLGVTTLLIDFLPNLDFLLEQRIKLVSVLLLPVKTITG